MPKVSFKLVDSEDEPVSLDLAAGASLMEGALKGGIEEILADCGGALACATCHVYVSESWWDKVGAPSSDEEDLLDCAIERRATSRLSCQIMLDDTLDGLVVTLPARQN